MKRDRFLLLRVNRGSRLPRSATTAGRMLVVGIRRHLRLDGGRFSCSRAMLTARSSCGSCPSCTAFGSISMEGRGPRGCLMNLVDDATSTTLCRMGEQETIWAAVGVLGAWMEKYGVEATEIQLPKEEERMGTLLMTGVWGHF